VLQTNHSCNINLFLVTRWNTHLTRTNSCGLYIKFTLYNVEMKLLVFYW